MYSTCLFIDKFNRFAGMKKLNREEASKFATLNHGNYSALSSWLMQLEIGEALQVEKGTDWKSKRPPYHIISYLEKKTKRKFETCKTPGKTSWIIKRVA